MTAATLRDACYDLLVTDTTTAKGFSGDLIEELRCSRRLPPTILMITPPLSKAASQPFRLPVVASLMKPVEFSDLLIEIRRVLVFPAATQAHSGDGLSDLATLVPIALGTLSQCLTTLRLLNEALASHYGPVSSSMNFSSDTIPASQSPQLEALVRKFDGCALPPKLSKALKTLSPREQEILLHLYTRERVSAIARTLYISPHTVRNHLKSIFRKLEVSSQLELVALLGQANLRWSTREEE